MKKILLSTAAITLLAGAAYAENTVVGPVIGGSVEVEVKENAAGDYGATTTFNVGIAAAGLAYGSASVESVNGNTFEIDEWQIGTQVGSVDLSFGDQGGVFVESWSDYSDIIDPAMTESLAVSVGDLAVAVGFNDVTSDISDISNVQGAYTLGTDSVALTASADYNFNSEDWAVGTRAAGEVAGIGLGTTLSYGSAAESLAYEVDGTIKGITAYVNGNQDDMLRNVGAGYEMGYNNMTLATDVNYDIDAEELAPRVTVTFRF